MIVGVSRLVPRKGFDTAIAAVARMARARPNLELVIAGAGRDEGRLARLARDRGAPVRFLGRVSFEDLPLLYGCADVFAMLCRNRWLGLEQEGFGIVFLEAAACGVPQVAGSSGGAADAVDDGVTGIVVDDPDNVDEVVVAFERLLDDEAVRRAMGAAARARAEAEFSYEVLAEKLWNTLRALP
ncbi:MAG: glycosyltransferase [Actinomycetota bacterium]